MAGLLAQGAAQPHRIIRILRIEIHCLLALRHGLRPLLEHKSHAAEEVLRFRGAISGRGQRRQQRQPLVGLAGLQIGIGLGKRRRRNLRVARSRGSPRQACQCKCEGRRW